MPRVMLDKKVGAHQLSLGMGLGEHDKPQRYLEPFYISWGSKHSSSRTHLDVDAIASVQWELCAPATGFDAAWLFLPKCLRGTIMKWSGCVTTTRRVKTSISLLEKKKKKRQDFWEEGREGAFFQSAVMLHIYHNAFNGKIYIWTSAIEEQRTEHQNFPAKWWDGERPGQSCPCLHFTAWPSNSWRQKGCRRLHLGLGSGKNKTSLCFHVLHHSTGSTSLRGRLWRFFYAFISEHILSWLKKTVS